MVYLLEQGYTQFYEMGTGSTLASLMKNISASVSSVDKNSIKVESVSV